MLRSIARQRLFLQPKRFQSTVNALTDIESRWTRLPEAEQGAIADRLVELQKGDWKKMTLQEKRAAYYIAYGAHGARAPSDPTLNYRVLGWVATFMGISFVLWRYALGLRPKLRTQTDEWKEAEAELLIEQKQNPFHGPYAKKLGYEK